MTRFADLILTNGFVYTVDTLHSHAEAVAVTDKRILFVGDAEAVRQYQGPETEIIDLDGKMVLPGFVDSHAHASWGVSLVENVQLFYLGSLNAYLEALENFARVHSEDGVIYGSGWDNSVFPAQGPLKETLDTIVPDRPVSLMSEDCHAIWVNSKALEMAGITKDTPDPADGVIERDPETGEPSGTLRENAMSMVQAILPPYSLEQLKKGILFYAKTAARQGITMVHDPMLLSSDQAKAPLSAGMCRHNIEAYSTLEAAGRLTLRVRGSLLVEPEKGAEQVEAMVHKMKRNAGDLFRINGAKIFVDGVIEGGTAYLLEPYVHKPGFCSKPLWEKEHLEALCEALAAEHIQIHIHAIGDAATRMSVDAIEKAQQSYKAPGGRHLITHLQMVAPEEKSRLAQQEIIAVMQPIWFEKEESFDLTEKAFLGPERAEKTYPMKSLSQAGVKIAGASDFPVTIPCPPLAGIMGGVTRCAPGQKDPDRVLAPEERLTLAEMIECFTINGAYANFLEKKTGSIETGKLADMVVLDRNLFDIPAGNITDARVMMTLFEGSQVYRSESF
jgi:predicted amidohydrolase YtcJ